MGKNIIPPLLVFILGVFLVLNIIFSQNISPIYQGLVEGERAAIIDYMIKIKDIPALKSEFVKYANAYGRSITDAVFHDEKERLAAIGRLENMLQLNPKSRDVLYALYRLQNQQGDWAAAQEYFKRAREIDPQLHE